MIAFKAFNFVSKNKMKEELSFNQSVAIIKSFSKKEANLEIKTEPISMSYFWRGKQHTKTVTSFTILVKNKIIYQLPGEHIPIEFIECASFEKSATLSGSWEKSNNIEKLLNQFANHLSENGNKPMNFELNDYNIFKSTLGPVTKTMCVNYGLTDLLYKYLK